MVGVWPDVGTISPVKVALLICTGLALEKSSAASISNLPPAAGRDAIAIAPSGVGFVLKRTESAAARADRVDTSPRTANNRNPARMVTTPHLVGQVSQTPGAGSCRSSRCRAPGAPGV